jgi:hypothetical protein
LLRTVTAEDIEAVVRTLIEKAKKGDVVAARELLDRTIGKPASAIELSGTVGAPIGVSFAEVQTAIYESVKNEPQARAKIPAAIRGLIESRRTKENAENGEGNGENALDGQFDDNGKLYPVDER